MIDGHVLVVLAGVYFLGLISPGPNFVAVAHHATTVGRRQAVALAAGIGCVNSLWAALALGGVGLVFVAFPAAYLAFKLAGAGYLIWLGLRLILARGDAAETLFGAKMTLAAAFRAGVLNSLTNPKAAAFFGSAFAAAAPQHLAVPTLLAVVAIVGLMAFAWFTIVALLLSAPALARGYRRWRRAIERGCGALLAGFGVKLAFA